MSLEVLYSDNHLLALAKPACVPTVPDESGDESLFDRARAWVEAEFAKPGRAFLGVVHRLDRPVSGVVLFARTSKAASRLSDQFRRRSVHKRYLGVGEGVVEGERGEVSEWLEKDRERNRVRAWAEERPGAKLAQTEWRVLAREGRRVLLELEPRTGRSHQLRVAARSLGAPLLGDLKYGASEPLEDKSLALHAVRLEVEHPTLREPRAFTVEPPDAPWWSLARAQGPE